DIAEWLTSIGLGEYAQPFRGKPHRCERPARSDGSGSRKNRHPAADQAGNIYYARRRGNEDFLAALPTGFLKNGGRILRRAGEESPATFLKVLAQLVPRELQMEHSGTILSKLSDEQLGAMITELERQIADHLAGKNAKVINAQAEPAAKEWIALAPGAPYRKANPKSSPRELEYARRYARKRRAAPKGQQAAAVAPEPSNETTSERGGGSSVQ